MRSFTSLRSAHSSEHSEGESREFWVVFRPRSANRAVGAEYIWGRQPAPTHSLTLTLDKVGLLQERTSELAGRQQNLPVIFAL